MRLLKQFRVVDTSGTQHTLACYQDSYDRPTAAGGMERVDTVQRYRLNAREEVQRIDDDTFLTDRGIVLRKVRTA